MTEKTKAHINLHTTQVQVCSACGITDLEAPHHLDYVREHGVCVL